MAVNKNFVVKNGLEVNTDLVFADATTNRVGIGSTIPATDLDVIGGIAATDLSVTGVGTIVTLNGTTGIVTTVVAHNAQVGNLNITGVTTIPSLGTLSELYISGVATVSSLDVIGTANIPTGIVTRANGTHLNYTGISTVANLVITPDAVGTGATIGGAVGVITYIGDGSQLKGLGIGIGSTGSDGLGASGLVGFGFTQVNFVGIGSTGSDGLGASGLVGFGFTQVNFVGTGVSDVLFNTDVGIATIFIQGGAGGGGASVTASDSAPSSPSDGDLWYNSTLARLFIYYDDSSSAQWVDAAPFNQGGKFLSKYGDNAFGAIGYTGGTTSQASIFFTGDPNTGLIQPAADHVNIVAGGTKSLEVNPSGISVVGVITGDGSGLTGVASTDNIITTTEAKLLGGVVLSGVSTFQNSDVNFQGSQAGVTSITFDASADTLQFQDLAKIKMGAGGDLQLFHDGNHSQIQDAGTGNLYISGNSNVSIDKYSGEEMANFNADGSVQLYHDNVLKVATVGTGITVADNIAQFNALSASFGGTVTLTVTVGDTNSSARYNGTGSSYKYLIDSIYTPFLTLTPGRTYKFDQADSSNDGHPLRFYLEADKTTAYTTNVTTSGTPGNAGAYTQIVVTDSTPQVLHYQCSSHGYMGNAVQTNSNVASTLFGDSVNFANVIFTKDAVGTGATVGSAVGVTTYIGDGSQLTGIAAGGGSGQFNTSISGATQYDVTASMATAYTASASSSIRTVVHSIHICNISASEVTISGEMQTNFSFAHTIPVPAGSAVELLKQPKVLGPSETIELQASSGSALEATIIVEEKEDTALWDAQIALSSGATLTDLYTSSSYPSVVQSILLCNNDGSNDVKARVAWTDGSNNIQSYLVYDMVIPADSTVEICEQPKYLATGYKLRAYANIADRLEITASGKQIVS